MKILDAVKLIYEDSREPRALTDKNFSLVWKNTELITDEFNIGCFDEFEAGKTKLPLDKPVLSGYRCADGGLYSAEIKPVFEEGRLCGYIIAFYSCEDIQRLWDRSGLRTQHSNFCGNVRRELGQINALIERRKIAMGETADSGFLELQNDIRDRVIKTLSSSVNFDELSRYNMESYEDELVNISLRLEELWGEFEPFARNCGCEVKASITKRIRMTVNTERLRAAVSNLLINALMYNSKEQKQISLKLDILDKRTVIAVSDNGDGIPQSIVERALKPYGLIKDFDHGEGLGICVAKKFTERYGGIFNIESRQGEGTTITLSFPKADESVVTDLHMNAAPTLNDNYGITACIFSKGK